DTGSIAMRPAVEPKVPYRAKDFVPVAKLTESPVVLVTTPNLPVSSFKELIQYSRDNPGKLSYASTGVGASQHPVTELLKKEAGVDWPHGPDQGGGAALSGLMAGTVQLMFSNPVPMMPYGTSKRVVPLAITSKERLPALKDVPTMAELGHNDMSISFWNGVLA